MDNDRLLHLALEVLEERKKAVETQIAELMGQFRDGIVAPSGKRRTRTAPERRARNQAKAGPQSAAARKAVSLRMKAYWAERRKAKAAKAVAPKKAAPAKSTRRTMSAAAKKAISQKMKLAWAKRKAEAAKK